MKAMVYKQYGPADVLQLAEVSKPVPTGNQVLVRIHSTTVTSGDLRMRSFKVPFGFWLIGRLAMGLSGPRKTILGTEFSGDIEAVGPAVTAFRVGDPVFGFTGAGFGAYAEFVCLPETGLLASKPVSMSYEEAAAVSFGALTAMYFLRDLAKVQAGQKVLVYGASGGVGTAAIQIARSLGAHVTGVCSSENLNLVTSLGADQVIDYTQANFTQNGKRYDVILDTVGKCAFSDCKSSLTERGIYLPVAAEMGDYVQMLLTSLGQGKRLLTGISSPRAEDFTYLKRLMDAGELKTAIDKCFAFAEMAQAHRYADLGHKKGNVVVRLGS
jgi:NADPH:quinone reductase-like Zn-dependent oxidoreductase